MQVKDFLKEHYYTQILTLSEYREQILKKMLEKPKAKEIQELYTTLTKALSETEANLLSLDDEATWTWNLDEELEKMKIKEKEALSEIAEVVEKKKEIEDPYADLIGQIQKPLDEKEYVVDEIETTKIVAEEELVPLKEYKEKGIVMDADPNFWTLVCIRDGKNVWRQKAVQSNKVEVPLYAMTKAETESVKKSFRHLKGVRVWVQTAECTTSILDPYKFGACMSVMDKNYKWGVTPNDCSPMFEPAFNPDIEISDLDHCSDDEDRLSFKE